MSTTAWGQRDFTSLIDSLDVLSSVLQAEAEESERIRRPTPAAQAALRKSGVLKLLMPNEFRGFEATPTQMIDIIERITYADSATGWLIRGLITETAAAACQLPAESAAELFSPAVETLVAGVTSGQLGEASRTEDGNLRVRGRWQFIPGVAMATHVSVPVRVQETKQHVVCVIPRWALAVSDNWEMLGLHGSAVFDVEAVDVVVPGSFTFGHDGGDSNRGGVTSTLTPGLLASMNQGAWCQGVARRMLEEVKRLAERSVGRDGPMASDAFFAKFANHSIQLRATADFLADRWTEAEAALSRGEGVSEDLETWLRLASSLATSNAVEVSHFVHLYAGAHVMRNGVLQRLFRDAHAATQHRVSRHSVVAQAGRSFCGLMPAGAGWHELDSTLSLTQTTQADVQT
ncbi:hypothetical protein ACWEK5_48680 [Rhodococcus koreensis]